MKKVILNKEFQEQIQKFPDDAIMVIGIEYNNQKALFTDVDVKGIEFQSNGETIQAVLILEDDLSLEYETLLNGGEVNEKVHRK